MSSKRSTTSDGPVIDARCPRCADGDSVRKNARGRNGDRIADTYPLARARRREYGPTMRAMIDAGGHRLAAVEYQTLTERRSGIHVIAASRVPRRGHPADAQRRNYSRPYRETMRGLGQDPELTARLAMPTAPFNASAVILLICLPAGTMARGTPLGVQSSAVIRFALARPTWPRTFQRSYRYHADACCVKTSAAKACECRTEGRGDRLTGMFTNTPSHQGRTR